MKADLNPLCRLLDYRFSDPGLLELALTHRSAGKNNNERLEFLGDAVLNLIIAAALFERFPQASEGQLSRVRASLVNGAVLAELAKEINLGRYLHLGAGELKTGGFARDSILAGALEAVFGAVYTDSGYDACRLLIIRIYQVRLEAVSPAEDAKDPKTRLQEFLQARRFSLPEYRLVETRGEGAHQQFVVECSLHDLGVATTGIGGSRRKAEQEAAAKAIETVCKNQ